MAYSQRRDNGTGKQHSNIEQIKKDYLSMSQIEKRGLYSCKYSTVDDVIKWNFLGHKNPKLSLTPEGSIYKVDQKLNSQIGIFSGNIAALEVDAIVNAANNSLLGGGGVDAVIHRAAGSELLDECRTLFGCETGEAKLTGGYKLPARHVIHTVGPVGENPFLLQSCYSNSLKLAVANGVRTIAFPCVSTGVYGYPNVSAAHVVLQTVRTFLESNAEHFDLIIFCLFMPVDQKCYKELLQTYFPIP
ncbi:UNVERIFIED_CONTAM: hypothetical protein GTU68_016795 [Idotea baltica]|nr:hypothetical protein [Idotea baltica]